MNKLIGVVLSRGGTVLTHNCTESSILTDIFPNICTNYSCEEPYKDLDLIIGLLSAVNYRVIDLGLKLNKYIVLNLNSLTINELSKLNESKIFNGLSFTIISSELTQAIIVEDLSLKINNEIKIRVPRFINKIPIIFDSMFESDERLSSDSYKEFFNDNNIKKILNNYSRYTRLPDFIKLLDEQSIIGHTHNQGFNEFIKKKIDNFDEYIRLITDLSNFNDIFSTTDNFFVIMNLSDYLSIDYAETCGEHKNRLNILAKPTYKKYNEERHSTLFYELTNYTIR